MKNKYEKKIYKDYKKIYKQEFSNNYIKFNNSVNLIFFISIFFNYY